MSRWEPHAPARLRQAAFDLYAERGYDQTTVAQIAARAGLSERTFFRHFADKREVLFAGGEHLQAAVVAAVAAAPASAPPLQAVAAGIAVAGSVLPAVELARRRQGLIDAHPELQERELIKLATLAGALRDALRGRGTPDPAAELAAQAGVAVFRLAFARWVDGPAAASWDDHVDEAMAQLRALTAAPTGRLSSRRKTSAGH